MVKQKMKSPRQYRKVKLVKPKCPFEIASDDSNQHSGKPIPTESELLSLKIEYLVKVQIAGDILWLRLIDRRAKLKKGTKIKRKGGRTQYIYIGKENKQMAKCKNQSNNHLELIPVKDIDLTKAISDDYLLRGIVMVDPKHTDIHGLIAYDEVEFGMEHIFDIFK